MHHDVRRFWAIALRAVGVKVLMSKPRTSSLTPGGFKLRPDTFYCVN